MTGSLGERIAAAIGRDGPWPFSRFMEAALYDPDGGFFARSGRGAGRAGADFVTSPETGPLFGALVARALDGFWTRLGSPDPFVVVEAGAGGGRLAREVLRAAPACAPALRYVLVERSAALRDVQHDILTIDPPELAWGPAEPGMPGEDPEPVPGRGPIVTSLDELPGTDTVDGVIVANELLDNLPFDLVERAPDGGWLEVRVGTGPTRADGEAWDSSRAATGPSDVATVGEARPREATTGGAPLREAPLVEVLVPASEVLATAADALASGGPDAAVRPPAGARMAVPRGVDRWIAAAAATLRRGWIVLLDYGAPLADLLARAPDGWLRTYARHRRGGHPLEGPGGQDITADVAAEAVHRAAARAGLIVEVDTTQAAWLTDLGIDDLVAEGRAAWEAGAANPGLAALAGRSRTSEAAALTDPGALGAHRVWVLARR